MNHIATDEICCSLNFRMRVHEKPNFVMMCRFKLTVLSHYWAPVKANIHIMTFHIAVESHRYMTASVCRHQTQNKINTIQKLFISLHKLHLWYSLSLSTSLRRLSKYCQKSFLSFFSFFKCTLWLMTVRWYSSLYHHNPLPVFSIFSTL